MWVLNIKTRRWAHIGFETYKTKKEAEKRKERIKRIFPQISIWIDKHSDRWGWTKPKTKLPYSAIVLKLNEEAARKVY